MPATDTLPKISTWVLLVVGLLGVLMGINRTRKAREQESGLLQVLAAGTGLLLIVFSIAALAQGSVANSSFGYTILIMMVLGLSLCARQMERIPVTLVLALLVGLGAVWAMGHFGIRLNEAALMQKENTRNLLIAGGVVLVGAVVVTLFTIEKIIDLFLRIIGLGPIVLLLSALGLAHAIIVLATGNSHGVMRYLPFPW